MEVRLAKLEDMEGVKALLRKYHRDTISDDDRPDGFVTTAITDEQLTELIEKEQGVTVIAEPSAGGPDKILGFCFAAPWEFWSAWPLFRHMMEIIPDYEFEGKKLVLNDTYQYGPMCVDRSIRGTGAFEKLFFTSLDQFRDRFPVMLTFVNQINKRSENAHNNKAHMETIGTFDFGESHYFLMGIRTDAVDKYKKMTEIRIEEGTKCICNHCYSGDSEIRRVYSADSVREIGVGAFSDCTNLETVVLNEGLVRLKKEVFSGCTNLKEVHLPETLESIGEWAFRNCTSLKELVIPKSVKEICAEAFLGCDDLTIITADQSIDQ